MHVNNYYVFFMFKASKMEMCIIMECESMLGGDTGYDGVNCHNHSDGFIIYSIYRMGHRQRSVEKHDWHTAAFTSHIFFVV